MVAQIDYGGLISSRSLYKFQLHVTKSLWGRKCRRYCFHVAAVQLLSHVWHFVTPWTVACQVSLYFTISWNLLKFMFNMSVMPSNILILCWLLLLLPSIFPSIRDFSNESALLIQWPKYWSFNFSISPSTEYSGLISFSIDWFDLAVQGTLTSFLQHYSLKGSILQHSCTIESRY